jgi:DNA helicase-2/ATP-dependent DNA helicase PcrA
MQQQNGSKGFDGLVELLRGYFHGRGGDDPSKGDITTASKFQAALTKWNARLAIGQAPPANSILKNTFDVYEASLKLKLTGDPDQDWRALWALLEAGDCVRLKGVANDVRNVRLLERGTDLRQGLAQDWRDNGAYRNALYVTQQSFVTEHFATARRPETGIIVMNMHKAKGKQFDEVVIFEGWPIRQAGKIVANPDRIVGGNVRAGEMTQARQNFRVSVTRAKQRTTVLTPADDRCVLLLPAQ